MVIIYSMSFSTCIYQYPFDTIQGKQDLVHWGFPEFIAQIVKYSFQHTIQITETRSGLPFAHTLSHMVVSMGDNRGATRIDRDGIGGVLWIAACQESQRKMI